ncbi:hypothetical protein [Kordia jejudonensis]|nr:hypothetical protein [Kordia jejudonensis]
MKKNKVLNLKKNTISKFQSLKLTGGTTIKTKAESDFCSLNELSQPGKVC